MFSSACRLVKRLNEEHDTRYVHVLSGLELGASLIGTRHVGHGHDFHLGNCAPLPLPVLCCHCCADGKVAESRMKDLKGKVAGVVAHAMPAPVLCRGEHHLTPSAARQE